MSEKFAGLWPALVTPFDSQGKLSFTALEALVDKFIEEQLEGVYVTGSTGQWPLLTTSEREAILECVVQRSKGRLAVMAHVGAMTTDEAVHLAKHAARVGADAVSSVTPIYYGYSADVVFAHYGRIGSATELPLFIYHFESANKLGLGAREYARRILAIPNIGGMKVTSPDLYLMGLLQAHLGDRLRLFSGADELMCHALFSGAIGAIGTFYNLWGSACRQARIAAASQPAQQTHRFMQSLQTAIATVLESGSTWSFLQAAIRQKHGIDIGRPRAPLGMLDREWPEEDVARIVAMVGP
jgi:N-acetylneuraminate lyase